MIIILNIFATDLSYGLCYILDQNKFKHVLCSMYCMVLDGSFVKLIRLVVMTKIRHALRIYCERVRVNGA
jgi:hypothetical protein